MANTILVGNTTDGTNAATDLAGAIDSSYNIFGQADANVVDSNSITGAVVDDLKFTSFGDMLTFGADSIANKNGVLDSALPYLLKYLLSSPV